MSDDIAAKVEARVAAIKAEAATPAAPKTIDERIAELDKNFVLNCLRNDMVGAATLFCTVFRGQYVYVAEWVSWLHWSGHHWELDMHGRRALADVERLCGAITNALAASGEEEGTPLHKKALSMLKKLRGCPGRKELLECATSIYDPLVVQATQMDKQDYMISTNSGEVDLRTGECKPGNPAHYIMKHCPIPWAGLDAPCPNFKQYLLSCMNDDQEIADFLVRLLGYGLLGDKFMGVWAIMYGPLSRNGKDTLMNVLKRVLGNDLHVRMNVALLLEQKFAKDSSRPEPELIALRGARMAYASEANSRQQLDQAKIKDLTGNNYITARGINDKYMTEWKQSALLILLTNYMPRLDSDDDGFKARTLCIEWPVKFVDNPTREYERKIDRHMGKKMEAEDSGILALLVRGCMDVLANGLRIPDKVLQYTKEQMDAQDDIGRFIRECCELEEPPTAGRDYSMRVPASELLTVCNWWCKKILGNSYPFTPKKFSPALEKKGFPSKKSSVMYYLGLEVKSEIMDEYEADKKADEEKASRKRS